MLQRRFGSILDDTRWRVVCRRDQCRRHRRRDAYLCLAATLGRRQRRMVLAEVPDRRRREHALTDLLPIELPDLNEPVDERRHDAGGTARRSRDHEVAAPVFFGCRQRECRKRADTAV
jgi:hypothetical protein